MPTNSAGNGASDGTIFRVAIRVAPRGWAVSVGGYCIAASCIQLDPESSRTSLSVGRTWECKECVDAVGQRSQLTSHLSLTLKFIANGARIANG
jgi:hypothetical protein